MKKLRQDVNRQLEEARMIYFVNGRRASVAEARRAEMHNNREAVKTQFRWYEANEHVKPLRVKNTDFNPRANDGMFVVTIAAEFAWHAVPGTLKRETDTFYTARGYKTLKEAVNAAEYVDKELGHGNNLYEPRTWGGGHRCLSVSIVKNGKCYWQIWYRGARGKKEVLTPLTPET